MRPRRRPARGGQEAARREAEETLGVRPRRRPGVRPRRRPGGRPRRRPGVRPRRRPGVRPRRRPGVRPRRRPGVRPRRRPGVRPRRRPGVRPRRRPGGRPRRRPGVRPRRRPGGRPRRRPGVRPRRRPGGRPRRRPGGRPRRRPGGRPRRRPGGRPEEAARRHNAIQTETEVPAAVLVTESDSPDGEAGDNDESLAPTATVVAAVVAAEADGLPAADLATAAGPGTAVGEPGWSATGPDMAADVPGVAVAEGEAAPVEWDVAVDAAEVPGVPVADQRGLPVPGPGRGGAPPAPPSRRDTVRSSQLDNRQGPSPSPSPPRARPGGRGHRRGGSCFLHAAEQCGEVSGAADVRVRRSPRVQRAP